MPGNPLHSIPYQSEERGSPLLIGLAGGSLAGLLGAGAAYSLALRTDIGFLSPLRLLAWRWGDLWAVLVAVAALALGCAAAWLLAVWVRERGAPEAETHDTGIGLTDGTSLGGWDSLLIGFLPVGGFALLAAGFLRPHEALAVFAAAGAIVLGSRRVPRFPEVREDRVPYDDPEIERLLKEAGPEAAGREFRWRFEDASSGVVEDFRLSIPFSAERLAAAREKNHDVSAPADYARYIQEDLLCQEVVLLAAELRRLHSEREYPRFLQVANVLAFMRQFPYVADGADEVTAGHPEYPRYPIETLGDGKGDCEDFAILAAALLHLLGVDVVFLVIGWGSETAHAAIGVAGGEDFPPDVRFFRTPDGRRYYYCEATPPVTADGSPEWGWSIGRIPFEDPSEVTIVPITQGL
jgi:hypothetical protein